MRIKKYIRKALEELQRLDSLYPNTHLEPSILILENKINIYLYDAGEISYESKTIRYSPNSEFYDDLFGSCDKGIYKTYYNISGYNNKIIKRIVDELQDEANLLFTKF